MFSLVVAPEPGPTKPMPAIEMTPKFALKWAAAITLFGAGMHYLATGRKEADFERIITGAVLTLASLVFLL
ncbi:MAG: hypothetical protein HY079_03380 [Elusimicrobia bacterium]|nr:hypothetical protein [Elusimicrobiota bacterium]